MATKSTNAPLRNVSGKQHISNTIVHSILDGFSMDYICRRQRSCPSMAAATIVVVTDDTEIFMDRGTKRSDSVLRRTEIR